jgi:hypothetical protein
MTEPYFKKPRKALTLLTYNEVTELFFDSIKYSLKNNLKLEDY